MLRFLVLLSLAAWSGALSQRSTQEASFEAASIRVHDGPLRFLNSVSISGPLVTFQGYNRQMLIMEAYGLKNYQVVFSPEVSAENDIYYDISAKAEGAATPNRADVRRMLLALLAERFLVRIQAQTREMKVYALTVGKRGPLFQPSSGDAQERGLFGVHGRNQTLTMPRDTMEDLAEQIWSSFYVKRPVVNRTGLAGAYSIKLEATPEFKVDAGPQAEDISVFDAVQEQLGLKLIPTNASVPVIVVNRMQRPSEN